MSRHASPTAQLLRNSRLFSLPQALPRPIVEQSVREGTFRSSDSASTPYPLRQAIISPSSSRHRGDWGLKRSLPKRASSRSSTPTHTIIGNDTYESITDYASASPHVKTLQRFQELNVAMTRQDGKGSGMLNSNVMAMESALDHTDQASAGNRRWKYGGGGVRSMTPSEFESWLDKEVKGRRAEFMDLLKARAHLDILIEQRDTERRLLQEEQEGSNAQPTDPLAFVAKNTYTDWLLRLRDTKGSEFAKYLRTAGSTPYSDALAVALRDEWWTHQLETASGAQADQLRAMLTGLGDKQPSTPLAVARPPLGSNDATSWLALLTHVRSIEQDFLAAYTTRAGDPSGTYFNTYLQTLRSDQTLQSNLNTILRSFLDLPPLKPSFYNEEALRGSPNLQKSDGPAPLTTHPTAGLSYLRTNKILYNHPILGPQKDAPPIRARLIAKQSRESTNSLYGVAGFVADRDVGAAPFDITTPGGLKVDRKVENVFVDKEGRIVVKVANEGSREAPVIRDGGLEPLTAKAQAERLERQNLVGMVAYGMRQDTNAFARRAPPRAEQLKDESVKGLTSLMAEIEKGQEMEER